MMTATLFLALLASPGADRDDLPGVTMLDFHSESCGPCQAMRPAIQQLKARDYSIRSVDTEREPNLASRYQITAVPTFVMIDDQGRELGRTEGARPAIELANLYNEAVARVAKSAPPAAKPFAATPIEPGEQEPAEEESTGIPRPWQTAVRICISEPPYVEFGSGTIISSTPDETIILTCAHIFKSRGDVQVPLSQFRKPIRIDLFDGVIRGTKPASLRYSQESFAGEAIDYDYGADVGLIRFRPGRKLAASPVVPASWKPKVNLDMDTVGCPGGKDATAWSTRISRYEEPLKTQGRPYHAIECIHAPQQGRSGGGLFTKDGYLAGVCDFADYNNQRGLYAAPTSIYKLLDKNNLTLCYAPEARPSKNGALLASKGDRPAPKRTRSAESDITMPPPGVAGVKIPDSEPTRAKVVAWQTRGEPAGRQKPAPKSVAGSPALAQNSGRTPPLTRLQSGEETDPVDSPAPGRSTAQLRAPASSDSDPFDDLGAPATSTKSSRPTTPQRSTGGAWKAVPKGSIAPTGR